jgi:hypothetical protein
LAARRLIGAVVAALVLWGLETACGRGGVAPGVVGDSLRTVERAGVFGRRPASRVVRAPTVAREPAFPHDPHRAVSCVTCHRVVASHVAHERLDCTECHAAPAQDVSLRALSPRECLECHHDERQAAACPDCHAPASLEDGLVVQSPVRVSTWETSRDRAFSFDHGRHASVKCQDCHESSVLREFRTECRACHEPHHRVEAGCGACHTRVERTVHVEAAHAGCGGTTCHQDALVAALPPARPVCLACHGEQVDHEAGRECADCHAIPGSWRRAPLDGPVGGG